MKPKTKRYLRGACPSYELTDSCRRCAVPIKSGMGVCDNCFAELSEKEKQDA